MTPALHRLDDADLFDWLRLSRSDNVGPRTFRFLLARFGHARAAIEALPRMDRRAGGRAVTLAPAGDVEREAEAARKAGVVFLPLCDDRYPASLRAIDSAPPIIAVRGRIEVLQRSMLAIVGSRNASAGMMIFTDALARGLGAAGHIVVSGLARGIDAKAHEASLASGTVAVLAGGHARIYPSEHVRLSERIAETGAVLSEMPLAWEPRGRDFPRRNRIVSGLSLGVVVVEAARRSGSLITARFAGEQGREVFAVPGSPLDPRAEGTNALLREGATICTRWEDVVEAIEPMAGMGTPPARPPMLAREPAGEDEFWDEADPIDSPAVATHPAPRAPADPVAEPEEPAEADEPPNPRERVAAMLSSVPVTVDELVRLTTLPVAALQVVLYDLELDGLLVRHGLNAVAAMPRGGA